jgi:hypothetical protein
MLRRLVLIFMFFALPIQASWSVAAAYCAHETGASARHLGHHDHTHKSGDAEKSPIKAPCDADCGFHGHSIFQCVMADGVSLGLVSAGGVLNATSAVFHLHAVFDRPDRPKWLAAVPAASTAHRASHLI